MKPLIKWAGGKSRELKNFKDFIPEHNTYIEPFLGGGAVFFHLEPKKAYINDISSNLVSFYKLTKEKNKEFISYLNQYSEIWNLTLNKLEKDIDFLSDLYLKEDKENISLYVKKLIPEVKNNLILDENVFYETLEKNVLDKFKRTKLNNEKSPFPKKDLEESLKTGFTSGIYMYFRNVYNMIALNKLKVSIAFKTANYYFIREYCYGSMFRYNSSGEFNIPYGGASYNKKNFNEKINNITSSKIQKLFKNTEISCKDFEKFLYDLELSKDDFIFLDPPYDTEFSDYEGREFSLKDQERLCKILKKIPAKFLLIIKKTNFIYDLYKNDFYIVNFSKNYTYNIKNRNEKNVEHLIITNYQM